MKKRRAEGSGLAGEPGAPGRAARVMGRDRECHLSGRTRQLERQVVPGNAAAHSTWAGPARPSQL